jgi:hypothetical protein
MDEEICDGVKILCERMENNPDDFIEGPIDPNSFSRTQGRFYYDGRNIEALARGTPESDGVFWHLNQADKDALVKSYKTMMRNEFTRRVVEKLLEQPEPEPEVRYTAQAQRAGKSIVSNMKASVWDEVYKAAPPFVKYKASDRYAVGTEAEIRKWATE